MRRAPGMSSAYARAVTGTWVARRPGVRHLDTGLELELLREFERAELRRLEAQRATPNRPRAPTQDGIPRR